MEKKSSPIISISVVTVILLAALVGILVYFNLPAQRIRRMLKTTNKYIAEENYDEAILTLKKMLVIDPKNEYLYVMLANTYEKNGDIDKEIEFLQEAVTLMPDNQNLAEIFSDVNPEVTISEAEVTYKEPVSKNGYEGEHKKDTNVIRFDESKHHLNEWVNETDGAMIVETVTSAEETKIRTSGAEPSAIYRQVLGLLSCGMISVDANYIKNYYGIDASQLEGYVFAMSEDVTHVDTVAILKAKDASSVAALAGQLSAVQQQKAQELQDYLPDQYQIVAASSVKTYGNYVYLVMAPNAAAIERTIVDTLTPTVETRVHTSDVDPGAIYSQVINTGLLPGMITVDANYIENYYGIDASQLDGYVFAIPEDVTHADTVAILKAKNATNVPALAEQLSAVQQQKAQELQEYMPDQYQIVAASSVKTYGNYVYLVMSPYAAAIEQIIASNIS
ncbi:Tetratricopeptide repeat-containing protein [Oribacterium sp. KHPX15]|uniref:DUF4358 domain-containing protein n=1 Tax=Oribacterium sp. KHPX15 TaxID=1855342 RepID=UPI00089BFBB1|nr:DUF4358 domain-containing protein [Oribacterium sp. KHPX15]SDZ95986.1 Tetratricopeptide repeat-containing protein [Oribacterium sp. KHPX15]